MECQTAKSSPKLRVHLQPNLPSRFISRMTSCDANVTIIMTATSQTITIVEAVVSMV
jgi:hypothetical protein